MLIALAGGSWIILGVCILGFFGVVIGYYTRGGSGINLHPYRRVHGGAPGASHPVHDAGGSDRTASAEREVVKKWRMQDRPELAPPEERAAEREKVQRPESEGPAF